MSDFHCMDCGVCTRLLGEYYIIQHALWLSVVPAEVGMLCIGCLETRLNRRLQPVDFIDCGANWHDPQRSERLASRVPFGWSDKHL